MGAKVAPAKPDAKADPKAPAKKEAPKPPAPKRRRRLGAIVLTDEE